MIFAQICDGSSADTECFRKFIECQFFLGSLPSDFVQDFQFVLCQDFPCGRLLYDVFLLLFKNWKENHKS